MFALYNLFLMFQMFCILLSCLLGEKERYFRVNRLEEPGTLDYIFVIEKKIAITLRNQICLFTKNGSPAKL